RETARARAKVEGVAHVLCITDEWLQAIADQCGDERSRHDHALVDIELELAEPRLAGDVRRRHALVDAAVEERSELFALVDGETRIEEWLEPIQRQMQRPQD